LAGGAGFLDGAPSIAAPGPHFSASLERCLAILEGFDDGNRLQGIADIAERLQMSRSTVHRYVITLQALGFLEQGNRRRYGLTLGVTKLGCSATSGMSLVAQARSFMQELARQTGFGVDLGILDGPDVLLVECIASRRRGVIREGRAPAGELRLPVYCTALGKLLLATVPADAQRELLGELALNVVHRARSSASGCCATSSRRYPPAAWWSAMRRWSPGL
jgi:IclR family KDG regulon transcriptional repressor